MTPEEKKTEQLRETLARLEPMLPGSISEQWNVCGTPGCRCIRLGNALALPLFLVRIGQSGGFAVVPPEKFGPLAKDIQAVVIP